MKYLQQFERFEIFQKQYWVVPTDDRYNDCVDIIGSICNDDKIKQIQLDSYFQEEEFILVCSFKTRTNLLEKGKTQWYWSRSYQEMISRGFQFMGYINMAPDEIEDYEAKIEAYKYNL